MSNYVKATDFQAKDALASGNPLKTIKGQEINDEYNAIQTAIATKADISSPNLLGNPTAPTQALGNSSTRLATTAFVQAEINANESSVAITGGTIDGVAITGVAITGLATDLAVADGGTGKSTLAVNNVLLGNGTNAIQEVAPSTSGNVLTSNGTTWISTTPTPSIGEGQTWQNFTSSRTWNTDYTNNTGRSIMVSVFLNGFNDDKPQLALYVGGVLISIFDGATGNGGLFVQGIVPSGATYKVTRDFTSIGTWNWVELR